jgi:hypothetical protein
MTLWTILFLNLHLSVTTLNLEQFESYVFSSPYLPDADSVQFLLFSHFVDVENSL